MVAMMIIWAELEFIGACCATRVTFAQLVDDVFAILHTGWFSMWFSPPPPSFFREQLKKRSVEWVHFGPQFGMLDRMFEPWSTFPLILFEKSC